MGSMAALCSPDAALRLHRVEVGSSLRDFAPTVASRHCEEARRSNPDKQLPYGALPDGNMFDFEDIGLFFFCGRKSTEKSWFSGMKNNFFTKDLQDEKKVVILQRER